MGLLVQESCHVRDAAVVILRGVTGMLQERLGMPHVWPEVGVGGNIALCLADLVHFKAKLFLSILSSLSLDKAVSYQP